MGTTRYTNYEPVKWDVPIWSPDWKQVDNLLTNKEQGYQLAQAALNAPIDSSNLGTDPMVREQLRLYRQQAEADLAKTYTQPGGLQAGNKALQGYLRQISQEKQPGGVEYQLMQNKADIAKSMEEIDKSNLPDTYKQIKKQEVISRYKGAVYKDELNNAPATNLVGYQDIVKASLDFAKEIATNENTTYGEVKGLSELAPGNHIYTDGNYFYLDEAHTNKLDPDEIFSLVKPLISKDARYTGWVNEQSHLDLFSQGINNDTWSQFTEQLNKVNAEKLKVIDDKIAKSDKIGDIKELESAKKEILNNIGKVSSIKSYQQLRNTYGEDLLDGMVGDVSRLKRRNDVAHKISIIKNDYAFEAFKKSMEKPTEEDFSIKSLINAGEIDYYDPDFTELGDIKDASGFIQKQQMTAKDVLQLTQTIKSTKDNVLKSYVNGDDKEGTKSDIAYKTGEVINEYTKNGNLATVTNTPYGGAKVDLVDFSKIRDTKTYKALSPQDQSKVAGLLDVMEKGYKSQQATLDSHNGTLQELNDFWTQLTGTAYSTEKEKGTFTFDEYKKKNNLSINKSELELQKEIDDLNSGKKPYTPVGERSRFGQGTNPSQLSPEAYAYKEYKEKLAVNNTKSLTLFNDKLAQLKEIQRLGRGTIYYIDAATTSSGKSADDAAKYKAQLKSSLDERISQQGSSGNIFYVRTGEQLTAEQLDNFKAQRLKKQKKLGEDNVESVETVTFQNIDGELYACLTVSGLDLGRKNKSKNIDLSNDELTTVGIKIAGDNSLERIADDVLGVESRTMIQENKKIHDGLSNNAGYMRYTYPGLKEQGDIVIKRDFGNRGIDGISKGDYLVELYDSADANGVSTKNNRINFHTNNIGLVTNITLNMERLMKDTQIIASLKAQKGEQGTKEFLISQIMNMSESLGEVVSSQIYDKYLNKVVKETKAIIPVSGNFPTPSIWR